MKARKAALEEVARRNAWLRKAHAEIASQFDSPKSPQAADLLKAANERIALWEAKKTCSPSYVRAWRRVLRDPAAGIRRLLASHSDTANAMFQNTPFGAAFAARNDDPNNS